MEVLLLFALFISPASHSQELRRLEKRAAGFDQHLAELEEAEVRRVAEALKQKQKRQQAEAQYEHIRETYKRPPIHRDPSLEKAYQKMVEEREEQKLRRQAAYAQQRHEELQQVEQKNRRLKPREYDINGGRP